VIEKSLYDTGFLFAVFDEDDAHYRQCSEIFNSEARAILPEVVIPELAYMIVRNLGYQKLVKFLRSIVAGDFVLVPTETKDLKRAIEILEKYADSKVNFVDCVIVVTAERLKIKRILTVDRRHFNLFRPRHCDRFEIIP